MTERRKDPATVYIETLGLERHPEGGYYKSTFRSPLYIPVVEDRQDTITTPQQPQQQRHLYTSIYFLLRQQEVSHFHRLKSDELWYFHAGSALTVHAITPEGSHVVARLGLDVLNGEVPQILVPGGSIFGSCVDDAADPNAFSLVGCMVSPGFDFKDFELFDQDHLLALFPQHKDIIQRLAYAQLPCAVGDDERTTSQSTTVFVIPTAAGRDE